MANVAVVKGNGERAHRAPLARARQRNEEEAREVAWDPLRTVKEFMRMDPGEGLLAPLWDKVSSSFVPAFDVRETKEAFEYRADVPGVDPKDLDVRVTADRLIVTGKRTAEKSEHGDTYYTYERSYGSFTRKFRVPDGAEPDAVQARLKDGVLRIVLPKKPEAKPRHVPVKSI